MNFKVNIFSIGSSAWFYSPKNGTDMTRIEYFFLLSACIASTVAAETPPDPGRDRYGRGECPCREATAPKSPPNRANRPFPAHAPAHGPRDYANSSSPIRGEGDVDGPDGLLRHAVERRHGHHAIDRRISADGSIATVNPSSATSTATTTASASLRCLLLTHGRQPRQRPLRPRESNDLSGAIPKLDIGSDNYWFGIFHRSMRSRPQGSLRSVRRVRARWRPAPRSSPTSRTRRATR